MNEMPWIEIEDLSHPGVDVYARLTEAQLRNRLEPEKGVFIAESTKVIRLALEAGCVPLSILSEKKHLQTQVPEILSYCGEAIPVYTAEREVLSALTGFALSRGILCAMRRPKLPTVEEICRGARRIAVLENVVDATNIGAIMRSAAALSMDAVLVTPTCCDPLNRRAVRVSMGTVFQIPWTYIGEDHTQWPEDGMRRLKQMGFRTAAMALRDDSVRIDDPIALSEDRMALILGAEGDGLAAQTIAACDYTLRIPMASGVDSLNVAAASAVAFWLFSGQNEK